MGEDEFFFMCGLKTIIYDKEVRFDDFFYVKKKLCNYKSTTCFIYLLNIDKN